MATVEVVSSRPTRKAGQNSRHQRIYKVTGATDSAPAIAAAVAATPASVIADGYTLSSLEFDAIPYGGDLWEVVVMYSHKSSRRSESQNDRLLEVDDTETTFDFSGQTAHITEAINQTRYGVAIGAPDVGNAINVTDQDGPQGVDIEVVNGVITKTKILSSTVCTDAWIKARAQQVSKVNDAAYFSGAYDAGELLFSRFSGRQRGSEGDWHVSWSFKVGENETGITVAGVTTIDKKGFEYLWVKYEPEEDTVNNTIVPTAQGVYVAEVYKNTDFSTLGL